MLRYSDPDGKYSFTYPREWHVIGRTSEHLVLRLLDKNEFVAQATISGWKKAEAGKHTPAAEFKETVSKVMSWEPEGIVQDGELPMEEGRWMYRVAMKGKQEGVAVVQNFYLIAAANGEQAAVSVMVPQDKIAKLATKDVELLKTLELRK